MNKRNFRLLKNLFFSFVKIGIFTFGGGYAMIPLIKTEICEKKKWIEYEELVEIIVISESTPGSLSVNIATFIGQRLCGLTGSLIATLGLVLPSFLIISIITNLLEAFKTNAILNYALFGIRAGVLALIVGAMISMYKELKKNIFTHLVIAIGFVLIVLFNVSAFIVIVLAALAGLAYCFFKGELR